jgi:hypothetical protein
MPRGFSWLWLAIFVIVLSSPESQAQSTTPPADGGKSAVDEKKSPEKPTKSDSADDVPTTEVFTDPNAKRTLGIFAPINFAGVPPSIKINNPPDDRNTMQSMASRLTNTDPQFIKRYVEFFATELTRRDYLNALLNPPNTAKPTDAQLAQSRGLERAVDALTKPLIDGRANDNREFLTVYSKALFDSSLPKVLENNYLSRIDAMIVLGMAGSTTTQALDVYIKELKKPDQVIWVKLWAARGLTNAAQSGKVDLDASKSILAAEALIGFLESDEKLPWPAQMRAIEALGSLRVSTANLPRGKVDAASEVMKFLADPDARVEVRAWAAWALGMMKVSSQVTPYNYNLIGYELGRVAVELGEEIVQEFDDNPNDFERESAQAYHLASLLLFQVYPALIGEEGVRDSGLLRAPHPSLGASKPFLSKLDDLIKAVAKEAHDMLKAGGTSVKDKRNDLDAKVADLKRFLGSTLPKDRHLVPGGPEFAPGDEAKVAGAAGR